MAKSLKIMIEMAGAEEIKRQLEGVGEAGEAAFNKIVDAAKQTGSFKELDPGFLKQTFDELGTKAPEAIGKITQAVKSAGRMETLINALTGVENGLAKVQTAALAVDNVLGKALVRSLTMVARLLPAAFAAGTVGAIAVTTNELLRLSDAALQAGISIEELAKAEGIFRAMGASAKEAAQGVAAWLGSLDKGDTEQVQQAAADMKKFKVGTVEAIPAIWKLQEAEKGRGEAARLARKELEAVGLSRKTADEDELARIKELKGSQSDQLLQAISLFEKMSDTAERNRLIFANFDKTVAGIIIRMLDAGVSVADIKKEIAGMPAPTQAATNAATLLGLEWERVKRLFASGFDISPEALTMITKISAAVREAIVWFGQLQTVAGTLNIGGNTLRELQTILTVLSSIGMGMKAIGDAIVLGFQTAWGLVAQGAQTVVQTVLQFFAQMPGQIAGFFAGFGANLWEGIVSSAKSAWQTIIGWVNTAIEAVKKFFSLGGGQAAGAGAQGMARGGLMGGRGTGTSDSNLAWLSRGEHIMPAYAVRQPGVLQLLEALRRSGGNLRGVLDRMGHFAMGGMVGVPAYAAGGPVGGMSHVTIAFPGLAPISGLRASSAVVDELHRAAALAQVRSGGRKPSRYF